MIPCHPLLYLNFNSEFKNVVCVKFKCKIEKKIQIFCTGTCFIQKIYSPCFSVTSIFVIFMQIITLQYHIKTIFSETIEPLLY